MIASFLRWLSFNLAYFRRPPWDTRVSPPELLDFISHRVPGRALDLGCGAGTNVITLAKAGWEAEGVDFAVRAIREGRRRIQHAGVHARLEVGDVADLRGFSGPYDLILDIGCYHGLPADRRAAYRQNTARLLAPAGVFLLYAAVGARKISIAESEVEQFQQLFPYTHRVNGEDNGGGWQSAWFWFSRQPLDWLH